TIVRILRKKKHHPYHITLTQALTPIDMRQRVLFCSVKDFLNIRYAHRWIGRGGYVAWPPRSPDLTPIDFFLWGCIKNIVFLNPPTTRDDMKRRIRNACRSISRTVLLSLEEHFRRRIRLCQEVNGANIEHLLN
ncbi:hypothetical protein X777_15341, partial [Ooceraea biroi]